MYTLCQSYMGEIRVIYASITVSIELVKVWHVIEFDASETMKTLRISLSVSLKLRMKGDLILF
jgi:hypothetical protein